MSSHYQNNIDNVYTVYMEPLSGKEETNPQQATYPVLKIKTENLSSTQARTSNQCGYMTTTTDAIS